MKPELSRKRTVLLVSVNVLVCIGMLDLYKERTSAQVIRQQVDIEVKDDGTKISSDKTIIADNDLDKDKTGEMSGVAKLKVGSVKAITKRQILPDFKLPAESSQTLVLRACPGEYEPASFVVQTLHEPLTVEIKATNLKGPEGIIDVDRVDIRMIKRWYQAGDQIGEGAPVNQKVRLLTPELLLKDDSLIRNDHETKDSYVKLVFSNGEVKWRCISRAKPSDEENNFSEAACPIRDAKTLQPVTIPKNTAKQFWVTVHVPKDAKPGNYEGHIEIRFQGQTQQTLNLQLGVLPFELAENELESSIYFHWGEGLNPDNQGSMTSERRTQTQFKAELENLLAHGVDNPTVGVLFQTGLLPRELQLRKDVGMKNDHLYYLGADTDLPLKTIKEIIKIAREYGYHEVYFYGEDEASGDALKKQRPKWEQIHKVGGKIFVAGNRDNLRLIGDLQDVMVQCYQPTREISDCWHRLGHKIFSYGNPQAGLEDPEVYRRNYGLLLAINGYDGGMDFIYYETWNDFDQGECRAHNMVYPTIDGVIDTIQWEGYREGIDDLRYLATLRQSIKHAERNGEDKNAEEEDQEEDNKNAENAKAFINNIRVTGKLYWDGGGNTVISPGTDMDDLRDQIIKWILKLRAAH